MDNMHIYNAVREVPETAKKPIQAGRLKGKTDINPMWRIKVLTEQFGTCGFGWYYKVTKQWLEPCGDQMVAFVNIELYVKIGEEWSAPIFGTGGSMLVEQESRGLHVSDECYKMATTDAISVACKQLGIGADVYWQSDATKYAEDKSKEPDQRLLPVINELTRIGYSDVALCKTYKIDDISKMSDLQIKDFLQKAKKMPTKEKA